MAAHYIRLKQYLRAGTFFCRSCGWLILSAPLGLGTGPDLWIFRLQKNALRTRVLRADMLRGFHTAQRRTLAAAMAMTAMAANAMEISR